MSNKKSKALLVRIREFKERKAREFPELRMNTDTDSDYKKYHNLQYMQF